jgi:hypothetical protein
MARADEERLQSGNAVNQDAAIGDRLAATPVVVRVVVDAAANATAKTFNIPYDMYLVDVVVQSNATSGSGTLTVRTGTTAISDAIACATNHALDRAATLDDAQVTLTASTTYNVIANGANDRGTVYLIGMRY